MLMDKNKTKMKVCTNCGSPNIKGIYTMSPIEQAEFNIQNKMLVVVPSNIDFYGCKNCNYYGPAIEIKKENYESFKEKRKNFQQIKRSPGGINNKPKLVKIISVVLLIVFASLLSAIFLPLLFQEIAVGIAVIGIIILLIISVIYFLTKNKS